MSLELELQRNTETMLVLIDAIKNFALAPQGGVIANCTDQKNKADESRAENIDKAFDGYQAHANKNFGAEKTTPNAAEKSDPPLVEKPADPVVDYALVAKIITDTFSVDREKVITILAKYGAKKGPQLKTEDYAAFVKDMLA